MKQTLSVQDLTSENEDLKKKIKRYQNLLKEQKANLSKQETAEHPVEDVHESSVTRKLGHTDIGDISDTLELGSSVYKSTEDHYVSRAQIEHETSVRMIKKMDYEEDSNEFQNRDDISERSLAPGVGYQNLSSSMNVIEKGALNTAASVHLRDGIKEL